MHWFSDTMCGLPLFAPHFTGKLPLPYSLLHGTESEDSHEAAAQEIKTIFESDREKEIFLTISNRYNRRENALDIEHRRQAEEVNRRYYAEFRRDTLRTMYADDVVQKILSQQQALPLQQYRAGLEKAYPMFYLTIGIQMFGLERVGEFLCTFISFMVVLTQPVMQIQYTELYVRNPDDIDTPELKKHYFIRKRGFTFLELLTIARGHELFKEDTVLGKHRDYVKEALNKRVSPLVELTCPEEKRLSPRERMNKAKVIGNFFEERRQYRSAGESPCGERTTFKCWAATPGGVAQGLWHILLGLTFTVRLQMECSGNHVMMTCLLLLQSLLLLLLLLHQPVQQVRIFIFCITQELCTANIWCIHMYI